MIAESRKREPSAKICKQIDKLRQASCRVRPLAVGTITKKDRFSPVRENSGYRCIQILCDAGRYPLGIAESRKREPSAKICKQIDERRQASCRVRPLAVGTITKKDRRKPVFFCYGAAGRQLSGTAVSRKSGIPSAEICLNGKLTNDGDKSPRTPPPKQQ